MWNESRSKTHVPWLVGVFMFAAFCSSAASCRLAAQEAPRTALKLKTIDDSRVGSAQPDASAVADVDRDGEPEVFTSMQDKQGHPEVLMYDRTGRGEWKRIIIGVVEQHREEIEWVAVGQPFPLDKRYCVAVSVQHKKNGLKVYRLRKQGLSPFDGSNWKQATAHDYAGQGLRFQDLDGDMTEELVYATQGGNELGILQFRPGNGWREHVIDDGNNRAWWWLDGKFYDLNDNGFKTDFFVSTRKYGGSDVGTWAVIQTKPNDLTAYEPRKIHEHNALQIDTGYFFSRNRDRRPDVVMVNKPDRHVYLLDGRNEYEATKIPIDGPAWNVKIMPSLGPDHSRDSFVVAATDSGSLFWSFRWNNGSYEVRKETGFPGNYGHPFDGTFTIADVDRDGVVECITPDSAPSGKSKGLSYLDLVPAPEGYRTSKPVKRFQPGQQ